VDGTLICRWSPLSVGLDWENQKDRPVASIDDCKEHCRDCLEVADDGDRHRFDGNPFSELDEDSQEA
jgi:hypothetical protein